jgi:hypothetical protein
MENDLVFNEKALDCVDYAKKLIGYLKVKNFQEFLLNLNINSEEYRVFHDAYITSCGNNWDWYELLNRILKQLLNSKNISYPLGYSCNNNSRQYIGKYKDIEIFKVDAFYKSVEFSTRTLDVMNGYLQDINHELGTIKEILSLKKTKITNETLIDNSLERIEQQIKNVIVPWEEFSNKQDELKSFFESVGFTIS